MKEHLLKLSQNALESMNSGDFEKVGHFRSSVGFRTSLNQARQSLAYVKFPFLELPPTFDNSLSKCGIAVRLIDEIPT
jgi:hypothetical protein